MENIAGKIDHTLLKAEAGESDIRRICAEARQYGFASVCVNSCYTKLVGARATAAKAYEAACAKADGAGEIDMVINVGALKEGRDDYVEEDIRAVVEAAAPAIVKVIIETCLLTGEEKVKACLLAEKAGAAFVKTSTGFSKAGATAEDVALMKKTVGDRLKVKAAGGIHTPQQAQELLAAGADRIGASNGIALLG